MMDTDYDTYAATFSCVNAAGMGHRKNGMILSRRPDLDNTVADKLRKLFDSFGVGPSSLRYIDLAYMVFFYSVPARAPLWDAPRMADARS